jgi:hypothetical protein
MRPMAKIAFSVLCLLSASCSMARPTAPETPVRHASAAKPFACVRDGGTQQCFVVDGFVLDRSHLSQKPLPAYEVQCCCEYCGRAPDAAADPHDR